MSKSKSQSQRKKTKGPTSRGRGRLFLLLGTKDLVNRDALEGEERIKN
ncbi:MAG: hypothetical protein R6V17_03235 [Halanaerobacter sp.]